MDAIFKYYTQLEKIIKKEFKDQDAILYLSNSIDLCTLMFDNKIDLGKFSLFVSLLKKFYPEKKIKKFILKSIAVDDLKREYFFKSIDFVNKYNYDAIFANFKTVELSSKTIYDSLLNCLDKQEEIELKKV